MSGGFELPWYAWLLMLYIMSPLLSLAGFAVGCLLAARGGSGPLRLALGGLLGSLLLPWLILLGEKVVESPTRGIGLAFLLVLALSAVLAVKAARQSRRY